MAQRVGFGANPSLRLSRSGLLLVLSRLECLDPASQEAHDPMHPGRWVTHLHHLTNFLTKAAHSASVPPNEAANTREGLVSSPYLDRRDCAPLTESKMVRADSPFRRSFAKSFSLRPRKSREPLRSPCRSH